MRTLIVSTALTLVVLIIPLTSSAATFGALGIGGRISQTPPDLQSTIVCNASYGPFTVRPFHASIPGPYFIRNTTSTTPRQNGYFLGLYQVVPNMGTCTNPETGAPIPAFEIKTYGASR